MTEPEPEYHEMPTVSEVFGETAQGVIKALGHPGHPTLATFEFWVGVDPADGEMVLAAAQSVASGWSNRAGGTGAAARELRALVRRWLDLADASEGAA